MVFAYRKITKIALLSIFLIYSCNIDGIQNQNANIEVQSTQNQIDKYIIKGKADLLAFQSFKTKSTPDLAIRATVSLIYPSDYSDINLREATIATGLTDNNGYFTINAGFTPTINQVFILESAKRSKGVGYSSVSLRTHIRWNGNKWESISGDSIKIDKRTTSIAILSSIEPNILSSSNSINKLSYNGTIPVVSYNSNFTEEIYKKYYSKVISSLDSNIDPVRFYSYNDFLTSQDRAKTSSVKSNMHTFQTIIETYSVDWNGLYPETVELARQEAQHKKYWKNFKNPFNSFIDAPTIINDSEYQNAKTTMQYKGQPIEDISFFRGAITYKPIITNNEFITQYILYGIDEEGDYILEKNSYFILTNG